MDAQLLTAITAITGIAGIIGTWLAQRASRRLRELERGIQKLAAEVRARQAYEDTPIQWLHEQHPEQSPWRIKLKLREQCQARFEQRPQMTPSELMRLERELL